MFFVCTSGSSYRVPETNCVHPFTSSLFSQQGSGAKEDPRSLIPEDVDIMDVDEMQKLLKKIILNMRGAEEPDVPEPGEADDDKDLIQAISNFGGKRTSKPSPWNGEDEKAVKSWTEKRTMYMSNAGDKIWRNVLKKIQSLSNDADLEDEKKVNTLVKSIGINPMVAEELQESLYDQLVQYTDGELLSDVQIAGPCLSFNSYRKGLPRGKEEEEDCRKYSPRAQQGKSPGDRREHGRVGGEVQEVEERHRVLEEH